MAKEEFLSEERYQKSAKKLKRIGKTLLIVGIITLVIGIFLILFGFLGFSGNIFNGMNSTDVDMSSSFADFGSFAIGGFVQMAGFIMTAAGIIVSLIAHKREITAFSVQQVMPVAQEGIDKMAPTIGNAAGEIAKGIKKGLNEADKK